MSADLTDQLLAGIRDSRLLEDLRFAELSEWIRTTKPEPTGLVKYLRRNAWLTDFQIKEISRGRGRELILGPYKLLELLGEGGMGRVFKAHHTRLGRDVALKVIRKEKLSKPSIVQRFHQEIRAAAQLSHPNVVLAFDADEVDGIHYYAMEFVEGIDLTKVVRDEGPMPIAQACDAIRQSAIGLQHAYERGLVHRDVKPSNVMRNTKGQFKVLDLGLAMLNEQAGGDEANRVTQEGLVLGTPDFLAPEQAQNPTGVDIRADIYALGATLYYLLTGKVPFEGATPADKLIQHVTAPPPNLLDARPDAPPQLDGIIKWLMNKRPEDRAQTPAQVAAALLPYCPQGTSAHPSNPVGLSPFAEAPIPTVPPHTTPHVAFSSVPEYVAPAVDFRSVAEARKESRTPPGRRPSKKPSSLVKYGLIVGIVGAFAFSAVGTVGYVLYEQVFKPIPPLPVEFTIEKVPGLKMIRLDGGSFEMGSPDGESTREADEYRRIAVEIDGPFFMSATEVTNGEFRTVTGGSPAKWATRLKNSKNAPVDSVTYEEAVEFCRKLTKLDAERRAGWAYRLPTEAEWEYACRAGSGTPFSAGEQLIYGLTGFFNLDKEKSGKSGLGEEDLSKVNLEKNLPYPVRSSAANAFGLFEMHGNVQEWVADYYEPSPTGGGRNPTGPKTGDWRVLKGGSWQEVAGRCRSASRRGMNPATRKDDVGFRIAFAPVAAPKK